MTCNVLWQRWESTMIINIVSLIVVTYDYDYLINDSKCKYQNFLFQVFWGSLAQIISFIVYSHLSARLFQALNKNRIVYIVEADIKILKYANSSSCSCVVCQNGEWTAMTRLHTNCFVFYSVDLWEEGRLCYVFSDIPIRKFNFQIFDQVSNLGFSWKLNIKIINSCVICYDIIDNFAKLSNNNLPWTCMKFPWKLFCPKSIITSSTTSVSLN